MSRLESTNAIPFGVALQALALFVAAFFMGPGSATSPEATGAGGNRANTTGALTSLTELPRDLKREMLPVPRVPERENRNEPPQPTPAEGTDSLISVGAKLASLRTSSVSLSGLVAIPISAPMLGVPDSLDGLSLAGGAWLGGGSNSSRGHGSRRGGGPSDMGGGGRGMGGGNGGGGYCPTPGRIGGGRSRGGGGGGVSAGTGRPRGGGGSGATGTASGGTRGRPAGPGSGGAARGKGGKS